MEKLPAQISSPSLPAQKKSKSSTKTKSDQSISHTKTKLDRIRQELLDEYKKRHRYPWIVAYSGGKDSTLLLQLVFEMLLKLPHEDRRRHVHVVGNDTLVESPLVISHLRESIKGIRHFSEKVGLPVHTVITKPDIDQTFWVNVIGRGYVPPSRNFRWCTDRMKILPTSNYIVKSVSENGKAILLIGARKSESATRRRSLEKHHGNKRLSKHPSLKNCSMFSPISELETDEVWMILLQSRPPWGGNHRRLVTLYRNARGNGECPLVLSKEDAPSCGSSSPRFGCWTCTVVPKDRSMSGLIDAGFEQFEPLMNFRDWLQDIRNDNRRRMKIRRDGTVRYNEEGKAIYGPFKIGTRREILRKLDELEKSTQSELISYNERVFIEEIWHRDSVLDEIRNRRYLD